MAVITSLPLPFLKEHALNTENLKLSTSENLLQHPAQPEHQDGAPVNYVPDQPQIPLTPTSIHNFLTQELETAVLDDLYPYLWLFTTPASHHIDPLHRHVLKGRSLIVSEDPKLHLVWFNNTVYLKPIPWSLLNHSFWAYYLPSSHRPLASGFLRSYSYLIRSRSDLSLAIATGLLPQTTTWPQWSSFIASLAALPDSGVAKRYHFGQLRLTRLNIAVRLFQPRSSRSRWYYHQKHWHTASFIERFFAPLLFVFASLSLALGSMQVLAALPVEKFVSAREAGALWSAFWGFSITVLLVLALVWLSLIVGPVVFFTSQLLFGARLKRRMMKENLED